LTVSLVFLLNVFQNSPLYQYLQDLGHTDFEICPVLSQEKEDSPGGNGHQEQDVRAKGKVSMMLELHSPVPQAMIFSHGLRDIGFRLDGLRTILQQEVLIQEDVELIELLDPGILSAGQTQNRHLPTLRSIATPNIWDLSILIAFFSALAALHSWNISSALIWGPGLLLLAIFAFLRAVKTLRAARLQVTLKKYFGQLETTVTNSRAFTNLVRKALRLIQETEVISRGFTLLLDRVSAACPYDKSSQHTSQHLFGLRKAVYRTVRTNFRVSRLATLYMLKQYPCCFTSPIDNVTNYICVVPLKDLGLGLGENQVSEEEAHNLTNGFSLPALKVLFQLWIGQSSEFFRRLALLLSTENACQGPMVTPDLLPHYVWSDVAQNLPQTQAACLTELKRSYEFYRYFETQHQSGGERVTKRQRETGELSSLHGAVRSLQLHLKALLNEVIILEDELEKLSSSKETQGMSSEASLVLEEKLKMLQPHVQASNTCWEEALCQVERMVRRPPQKKEPSNSSCENSHCPPVSQVIPALRIEDKDPVPEEQELEAYVEDTATEEFNREDVYFFSPEERERQKREREESKRVLQELKAVLGLKASEAERQKWKQLLFSDQAVIKILQPEEPTDTDQPSQSLDSHDSRDNHSVSFHGDLGREVNGTVDHHREYTSQEHPAQPNNDGFENEGKTLNQPEDIGPSDIEVKLVPPCPAPRTVLPASIKERLARIHQSSDLTFASGLAAQVAARSLTFTFFQEQTFGDEWEDDDEEEDEVNNGGNEDMHAEPEG
uniref:Vezatin n=1 Tax=Leptobrachium leishanense TaxID=445787 RepID=A0A8C5PZT4_9ANUR